MLNNVILKYHLRVYQEEDKIGGKLDKLYHVYKGGDILIPKNKIGKLIRYETDFFGNKVAILRSLTGERIAVPVGDLRDIPSGSPNNLHVCPYCGSGTKYGEQVYDPVTGHAIGCKKCMDPGSGLVRLF